MRIADSTEILDDRYGYERAIEMLAEAGFEALDLGQFHIGKEGDALSASQYEKSIVKIVDKAKECGLPFIQSHSPFPCEESGKMYDDIVRSIEIAGIIGAANIVVHPLAVDGEDEFERNIAFYNSLLPYAKKAKVRILLENMYRYAHPTMPGKVAPQECGTPENFVAHVDALDSEWFGACLDIGHIGMSGVDEAEIIHALGHRIKALHVHDNDGHGDYHSAPLTMFIDFNKVTTALHDIGYNGDFTLESNAFLRRIPEEIYPTALKYMAQTAKYLSEKI